MKIPNDFFQQIEREVLRNPWRLKQHNWHEIDGQEVIMPREVESGECAHCLFGWIIAMTPGGPAVEHARETRGQDTQDLANEILVRNGRLPLPLMLAWSDEASALKTIRGRAAEERAESAIYAA